jgi:hypothetical protein
MDPGESRPSRRDRRLPLALLGLAMAAAAAWTLYLMRGTSFTLDEWGFVTLRRGWDATALLEPHNGHLIVNQLLLYKPVLALFGAESHVPLRLLTVAVQLAVGGLVYLLAVPRIGALGALLPALIALFLGSGWEVLMSTAGISIQLALLAGLGMLLCLQRGDRRGDLGAALLLGISVGAHTIGLAFAAGAVAQILASRGWSGWQRLWIVAAPLALYGAWWLWALRFDQVQTSAEAVGSLPSGVYDQLGAYAASLAGIFRHGGPPDVGTALAEVNSERGYALVPVLIAAVVLRLRLGPPVGSRTWALLAILAAYLILVGLGLRVGRPPDASRYVYAGAILLLLLVVELCDGLSLGRGWKLAAVALTGVSLLANAAQMRTAGTFFRSETDLNRAELAALELGRSCIPRSYRPEASITTIFPHADMHFSAGEYFEAIDDLGSPAYSPAELAAASDGARAAAETVFEEALGRRIRIGTSISPADVCPPP